jgi:hypothetical protein
LRIERFENFSILTPDCPAREEAFVSEQMRESCGRAAQNASDIAVPASEVRPKASAIRTAIIALREARGAWRKPGSTLSRAIAMALVFMAFQLREPT